MKFIKNELTFFFVALFIFTLILHLLIINQDSFVHGNLVTGVLLMWTPGIAAILTLLFYKKGLKSIGWKLGKVKYLLISYFLPIFYVVTVYLICAAFKLIKFLPDKFDSKLLIILSIYPILNIVITIGEEIGWRGFLLPKLYKKYSFLKTSLIMGVIWTVWHLPLFFFTDFYTGPSNYLWLALICYSIYTIALTFAHNWLWLASRSIWVVSLLHSANNVYLMGIGRAFDTSNEYTEIFISSTGIITPLLLVIIAFIFWKRKNKLPTLGYQ